MTVVVIGPPGSGKSSVGRCLAGELGKPFVDTDERLVSQHGPISEIFARAGESHFRQLERKSVHRALKEDAVVALGGGAVLDLETQYELSSRRVVLLSVNAASVESRLTGSHRPLVGDLDSWIALNDSRQALYQSLADLQVDTSGRSRHEIVAEIAKWVRERP